MQLAVNVELHSRETLDVIVTNHQIQGFKIKFKKNEKNLRNQIVAPIFATM